MVSGGKHTPGPWEADAEDMQQGAYEIFTISIWAPGPDGDRPHIGAVSAFSLLSETRGGTEYVTTDAPSIDKLEEAKANARLIAAAPCLLEALQAAYDALGISYPLHSSDMDKRGAILAQARAAIAKATGEGA